MLRYCHLLRACIQKGDVETGKILHSQLLRCSHFKKCTILHNMLLELYVKSGNTCDAGRVFGETMEKDACSWTLMISCYAKRGVPDAALHLFRQMTFSGVVPNHFTFSAILSACGSSFEGMQIHERTVKTRLVHNLSVNNALIDMYGRYGLLENARNVFDRMSERDVVSWTAMLAAYANGGFVEKALQFFEKMPCRNTITWNALIAAFAEVGFVDEAMKLFDEMPKKTLVSATAIVAGLSKAGRGEDGLKFFGEVNMKPDLKAFCTVAKVCTDLLALQFGMQIHCQVIKSRYKINVFVMNALLDLYSKCGCMVAARKLFDRIQSFADVVSWTTMIYGYVSNGDAEEALKLFRKMPQRNEVSWNAAVAGFASNGFLKQAVELFQDMPQTSVEAFCSLISGLADHGLIDQALKLFEQMPTKGIDSWNCMLACLLKNFFVEEALLLFREMGSRNIISWNTMIAGLAQNGHGRKALHIFQEMRCAGVSPDSMTFGCILPICSHFAGLDQGKEIHGSIVRSGVWRHSIAITNGLIDMYAKCGNIQEAHYLFLRMREKDIISWTIMISGYAMHGSAKEALMLFHQLLQSEVTPDHITFTCILFACSHAGLVNEGFECFRIMKNCYNIAPTLDHYNCLVDLLGRAGHLLEAKSLIREMPVDPDVTVWNSLLGSCRIYNNVEIGEQAFQEIFRLDPLSHSPYAVMSSIYAAAGKWSSIERLRKLMKEQGVVKMPGCSWIELENCIHPFLAGGRLS